MSAFGIENKLRRFRGNSLNGMNRRGYYFVTSLSLKLTLENLSLLPNQIKGLGVVELSKDIAWRGSMEALGRKSSLVT
jgi:hypothetical protein